MRSTKIIKNGSSSLWTCSHHMVIIRTRNKITDFFKILAWASPFKLLITSLVESIPQQYTCVGRCCCSHLWGGGGGGHSASLPVRRGVGPSSGALIMGRLLGCAVRDVPRFR